MLIIPFTLKFLTPAYIGGSDNVRQTEFRLPSLKGVLRYWWRQFQRQANADSLFKEESRIFGCTEGRSRVSLRICDTPDVLQGLVEPSPGEFDRGSQAGLKYLLYSCERRGQAQPGREKWIKAGGKVSLGMQLAGSDPENKAVILAVYFAQSFGGLGLRSRRGAGSFSVVPAGVPPERLPVMSLFAIKAENFIGEYRKYQNKRHDPALAEWLPLIAKGSPLHEAFTQQGRFREVSGMAREEPLGLLNRVGAGMKKCRSVWEYKAKDPNPFHREAQALHGAGNSGAYLGPDPLSKSAFGLPIIYRFKQRDPGTGTVVQQLGRGGRYGPKPEDWSIEVSPVNHARRASPLFMSVHQDANGVPYANLLILWDVCLPGSEGVTITKLQRIGGQTQRTALGTVGQPDVSALVNFLADLTV